jgi:hypothetical protein
MPAESLAFMPPPTDSQYLATLSSRPVRVTAS